MNVFKNASFLFLSLFFVGCSFETEVKETSYKEFNLSKIKSEISKINYSKADLIAKANHYWNLNAATRSSSHTVIDDTLFYNGAKTRALNDIFVCAIYNDELDKTLFFSNDRSVPDALAEINGKYYEDVDDAFSVFVDFLPSYLQEQAGAKTPTEGGGYHFSNVSFDGNTFSAIVIPPIDNPGYPGSLLRIVSTSESDTIYSHNPLTKVHWHQRSPYNSTLPLVLQESTGEYVAPPTGCVAVALAQILSVFKAPSTIAYNGDSWGGNWNDMTSVDGFTNANDIRARQIALLMEIIGKAVHMEYTPTSGSSNINNAYSFLRNTINFQASPIENYSFSKVIESLSQDWPLYMRGANNEGIGHAWVVDGAKIYRTTFCDMLYEATVDRPSYSPIIESQWRLVSTDVYHTDVNYVNCNFGHGYSVLCNNGVFQSYNTGLRIIPNIHQ